MKQFHALALLLALTASAGAAPAPQDASASPQKKTMKKSGASTAADSVARRLDEMQKALDAQQQQIQQLRQDVQSRDAVIQQLQQQGSQTQTTATQAQQKVDTQSQQTQQDVAALRSDVNDLKSNVTNTALSLQESQKQVNAMESPLAIHFKGVTITPGGFLAAETVWRQRALAADINTPFNSVPFGGASQSKMSEFFGSGRQSRVSMLTEGKLKSAKLSGYVEADFLSAGVTSNNNQSNSYTLRQRQAWGQAALNNGWSFTGGQMWSLITETKKGVDNRTEALPMTIDPQYTIGFSWARQYGFRVAKNLSNKVWLAFAVEDSQETLTAHGASNNFLVGSLGNSGGLYNAFNANYSFNPSPDFVVKAAFEPGWGHYEVFGLISDFRDRIFPNATAKTPSAAGAFNDSRTGGGIGANARGSVFNKHVDVGVHFFGGNGIGRYGTGGLPDATVHPDGTLALIRNYQALGTLEWHSPKWDIYANAGGEYDARTAYETASGKGVGYGSPLLNNTGCSAEVLPTGGAGFTPGSLANCTGDTRNIIEGTFGFWYRFYNGPKGRIQWGPQYSYVVRNTWSGTTAGNSGQPHAVDNMFFTSFRYYLP
jgi:hypothetical protein